VFELRPPPKILSRLGDGYPILNIILSQRLTAFMQVGGTVALAQAYEGAGYYRYPGS
jgi:hypothetical protein